MSQTTVCVAKMISGAVKNMVQFASYFLEIVEKKKNKKVPMQINFNALWKSVSDLFLMISNHNNGPTKSPAKKT